MERIHTKVVHSTTKTAWNVVVDITCSSKYKIARIPYNIFEGDYSEIINTRNKHEALEHAQFISDAFNADYAKREDWRK